MPSIAAHAKLNLGLEILGRRDDGFHDIRGVFARLELHDTLTIRPAGELGVRWPAGTLMPQDDLIRRAANLLRQTTGTELGARITLEKSIPLAGGLGGGSSDAAATLFALNETWQTGLNLAELSALGAQIGSDVPFFLSDSPALVSGRGEIIESIDVQPDQWVVLVAPAWEVPAKTQTLFRALRPDDFSKGESVELVLRSVHKNTLAQAQLNNTFERVIDTVFPDWSSTRSALEDSSGVRFWLTGAGPCMYALLPTEQAARQTLEGVSPLGVPSLVTRLASGPLRVIP